MPDLKQRQKCLCSLQWLASFLYMLYASMLMTLYYFHGTSCMYGWACGLSHPLFWPYWARWQLSQTSLCFHRLCALAKVQKQVFLYRSMWFGTQLAKRLKEDAVEVVVIVVVCHLLFDKIFHRAPFSSPAVSCPLMWCEGVEPVALETTVFHSDSLSDMQGTMNSWPLNPRKKELGQHIKICGMPGSNRKTFTA